MTYVGYIGISRLTPQLQSNKPNVVRSDWNQYCSKKGREKTKNLDLQFLGEARGTLLANVQTNDFVNSYIIDDKRDFLVIVNEFYLFYVIINEKQWYTYKWWKFSRNINTKKVATTSTPGFVFTPS